MIDTETFRSAITHTILQRARLLSVLRALPGVFILLYGGTQLDIETLGKVGFILFLAATLFFLWGALPLKRLLKLEKQPNTIVANGKGFWVYLLHSKPRYFLWRDVENITFEESSLYYGIRLSLQNETVPLPYFSKRAERSLLEIWEAHRDEAPY